MRDDGVVCWLVWKDDDSGEEIGVDYGDVVRRLREEAGDGGFAGRNVACEADDEHDGVLSLLRTEINSTGYRRLFCVENRRY